MAHRITVVELEQIEGCEAIDILEMSWKICGTVLPCAARAAKWRWTAAVLMGFQVWHCIWE